MQLDFHNKPRVEAAHFLAQRHHEGVVRKYTGAAYLTHPVAVAELLLAHGIYDENSLSAALLHDCLEDPNVEGYMMLASSIEGHCGVKVARWVGLLTNTERGNRATRKALANKRLAAAPAEVQTIKLADIIDNLYGIADLAPDFAPTYLEEKRVQIACLTRGNPKLLGLALDTYAVELNKLALGVLTLTAEARETDRRDDLAIAAILDRESFMDVAFF